MTVYMAGNAYFRLIMEIVIHANRFRKQQKGEEIQIQIAEKDLAAESGMTRETVSRKLKILKERGLVTFQKNTLIIKDLRRLEEEL